MEKKRGSLSVQFTLFVLMDLLGCVLAGLIINIIGKKVIDQCSASEQYALHTQQPAVYYSYLLVGSVICISVVFLAVFFVYAHFRFRYIELLNQEVQEVEEGELSRSITIKGNDEMTDLAESMENMRHSFTDKMLTIEKMQKEQNDLVAEMSHDMRTPLTALMMYLDFLKEQRTTDAETCRTYINKACEKANCIKVMMDDLFSYFRLDREMSCELEQAAAPELLYEFVSEISAMLEQDHFQVQEHICVPERSILFCSAYMSRIAGNVCSNIRKYADRKEPVRITLHQEDTLVHSAGTKVQVLTLTIRNRKMAPECPEETAMESMGLGIRNIQKMMENMAGDMFCIEDRIDNKKESAENSSDVIPDPRIYYELRLMFRITNEKMGN
ncbi:MAG: HAMP domain-containing sensor histidine kinase [Lachnospiraceae bacterium]|nr:HAMP domain-containing sensor histidine kinase [Lachnospiraceae bacterium]